MTLQLAANASHGSPLRSGVNPHLKAFMFVSAMSPPPVILHDRPTDFVGEDVNARWYAINTQPSSEDRARLNLERQGWSCFCPMISASIRLRGRMFDRVRPLFTGYMFLKMDADRYRWRSIDSTYGVRSILKHGDRPVPLPVGCVEALIEMTSGEGLFSFTSRLTAGDQVKFLKGPFAGFIGTLEQLDSHGRIRVLLDLLGRQSVVKSTVSEVAPFTGPAA